MIYFTADLHLGHASILKLASRPFSSVEEMDERLIANWNERVKGNDTVYIVGDLLYKAKDPEGYLSRLKGKKILVRGNHDGFLANVERGRYFKEVASYMEENIGGKPITLCHYPMLEWKGSRRGEACARLGYLIHGHIHNRIEEGYVPLFTMPHALNAGVDINGFAPVTFEELVENNARFKEGALKSLTVKEGV